jgi:hypothetical protein
MQNIPITSGMFFYKLKHIGAPPLFDGKIDQPPSTATWLMEAGITNLRGLGPRKKVIS